jgi:hypothetical protein
LQGGQGLRHAVKFCNAIKPRSKTQEVSRAHAVAKLYDDCTVPLWQQVAAGMRHNRLIDERVRRKQPEPRSHCAHLHACLHQHAARECAHGCPHCQQHIPPAGQVGSRCVAVCCDAYRPGDKRQTLLPVSDAIYHSNGPASCIIQMHKIWHPCCCCMHLSRRAPVCPQLST